MYDMYHWHWADAAADNSHQPASRPADHAASRNGRPVRHLAPAARAVQVALDRRDNGGDATRAE